mmetsp:Transcript_12687/g.27467  ORF Transcript_12687/g.27467 Transcript_12687/m.27467 type:complete len:268 (+) Transcript_12687:80-883(+)
MATYVCLVLPMTVIVLLMVAAVASADAVVNGVSAKLKDHYSHNNNLRSVTIADTDESLSVESSRGEGSSTTYVFLQKFPLQDTDDLLFHTEVLVCSRDRFSAGDQKYLDDKVASLADFAEIDESWWSDKTTSCTEFGYGGNSCTKRCCAVPHGADETNFPLNEHRAVISNAKVEEKSLFLYGTGHLDGEGAYHRTCDKTCWSNWAGTDYNPLTNNCNTFTSTVLHCVFGLSEKKPNLGPSDMVTVTCDKCPSEHVLVDSDLFGSRVD